MCRLRAGWHDTIGKVFLKEPTGAMSNENINHIWCLMRKSVRETCN